MNRILFLIATLFLCFSQASADRIIKILAIGNSFSEDAVEQNFREICDSEGIKVIVGNLYIGGCSIDTHADNAAQNKNAYRYRKFIPGGKMVQTYNCSLEKALKNEKWDYISFQQASQYAGIYSTYERLGELLGYVRGIVGEHPIFMWHMTWAYASDSKHEGFAAYSNSQLNMYHAIVNVAKQVMRDHPEFKILIPTGTAIQDARTALIVGDDLTRDGYHLQLTMGRYIAACTWYTAIFRNIMLPNVWRPKAVTSPQAEVAHEAAHLAVIHPWRISPLHILLQEAK